MTGTPGHRLVIPGRVHPKVVPGIHEALVLGNGLVKELSGPIRLATLPQDERVARPRGPTAETDDRAVVGQGISAGRVSHTYIDMAYCIE